MADHVVILGGGFGGLYAARRLLKTMPPQSVKLTLVNNRNFLLYAPLLPAVAGGSVEPRHVVVPLREGIGDAELRLGEITGADPNKREVYLQGEHQGEQTVTYDRLIVALGSVSRMLPIDGLEQRAIGFKTVGDGLALRDHVIACLEAAEVTDDPDERKAWLTFVFTGGGYTGVEGIAELQELAVNIIDLYPRCAATGMRWVIVEGEERIMREVTDSLAEFARRELEERGIEVRTGVHVDAVGDTDVHLTDGTTIATHTLAWTAGISAAPVVAHLGLPTDDHGRIRTDAHMRVPGFDDVWAVGDAAAVPDPANPGAPCPQTAQHAMRQGRLVADNVASTLGHGRSKPFKYKTMGMVVDLGRRNAVAELLGVNVRGTPAFVIARAYHLAALPGWGGRRIRIAGDWMLANLFRLDSSEWGVTDSRPTPLGTAAPRER
jgi:NADH:ubiquinone reductase (H+-translocating)